MGEEKPYRQTGGEPGARPPSEKPGSCIFNQAGARIFHSLVCRASLVLRLAVACPPTGPPRVTHGVGEAQVALPRVTSLRPPLDPAHVCRGVDGRMASCPL